MLPLAASKLNASVCTGCFFIAGAMNGSFQGCWYWWWAPGLRSSRHACPNNGVPQQEQSDLFGVSVNCHQTARSGADWGGPPPGCLPWILLGELRHTEKIRRPPHPAVSLRTFHRLVVQQSSAVALTTHLQHQMLLSFWNSAGGDI